MAGPQSTTSKETTSKGSTTIDKALYRNELLARLLAAVKSINETLGANA